MKVFFFVERLVCVHGRPLPRRARLRIRGTKPEALERRAAPPRAPFFFSARLAAGQVGVNCYPLDAAPLECPWVGHKRSGHGYHSGADGWRQFSVRVP